MERSETVCMLGFPFETKRHLARESHRGAYFSRVGPVCPFRCFKGNFAGGQGTGSEMRACPRLALTVPPKPPQAAAAAPAGRSLTEGEARRGSASNSAFESRAPFALPLPVKGCERWFLCLGFIQRQRSGGKKLVFLALVHARLVAGV